MGVRSSTSEDRILLIGLAVACVALLMFALYLTRLNSQTLLRQEAEVTAVQWADYLGGGLKNIEDIFEGRELSLENHWFLKQMQNVGDIFLFKIFDSNGVLRLVSSNLNIARATSSDKHHNETAKAQLLKGKPSAKVKTGTPPKRPLVYAEAYVPIAKDGRFIGLIKVYVDQSMRATIIHQSFAKLAFAIAAIMAIGFWLAVAIIVGKMRQRKRAEDQISFLAEREPLSGLLNRRSFNEAMHRAVNEHRQSAHHSLAFLWLDIKGLREINDNYSHAIGDQLIREFALRLKALVADDDITAGLGGDEFAILRIGQHQRQDIDAFAGMIARELNTVYEIGDHQIVSSVHIGIVLLGLNDLSAEELINCAETAKVHAKENAHLDYCYFDRSIAAEIQTRKTTESNLRRAMSKKEQFQLFYQPQFALDSGELRGFESLIRWNHPDKGMISPANFIPIAEDTGLICELGEWVLNQACKEAVSWPKPCTVAVNVSPVQFRQDNMLESVREALERSGLDPARLEIEVTESVLFQNTAQAIALIQDLKALGVRIAMDDFGSGFSSLTHLWQFPFDNIKIDHTFTRNLNSNAKVDKIVTSIIDLGYALGITITAEGVETAQQEAFLRNQNCKFVQGFRYGKPCPPEKIIFEDSVDISIENLSQLAQKVQDRFSNGNPSTPDAGNVSAAAKR